MSVKRIIGHTRTRRHRPIADINVVPYIDVSLVLLIIFMVTAPLLQTGVDVELPQSEAKTVEPSQTLPILITVDAEGHLFLDTDNQGDVAITLSGLTARITDILANTPERAVLIRGDKKVDYGQVVMVMATLKQAGVKSVGLMTAPLSK